MALFDIIQWTEQSADEILHKYNTDKSVVKWGTKLTVREGQACIFCDKGRIADVFGPGMYTLNTDTLPILTALVHWAYAFESPFKSDIYFVSCRQFVKYKWGTATPIIIRDAKLGAVRVRAYGTYSFKVNDAAQLLQELAGARHSFTTQEVVDYMRSLLVMGLSDAIGASGIGIADLSANILQLSSAVNLSMMERFRKLGLELSSFNIESISLPPEVEKAIDENARLGLLRDNADLYARIARADAMVEAAKNAGMAGSVVGAGIGLGLGADIAKGLGGTAKDGGSQTGQGGNAKCAACGAEIPANAKFCPECGSSIRRVCPQCGRELSPTAKCCPECGKKL